MSADQSSPAIDAKALETATDIHVFDKKGGKVRFGDIFNDQKTIVVFIRAYYATRAVMRPYIHVDPVVYRKGTSSVGYDAASFSSCMQYVSQLATVRADALEEASTKIVVVGCGDWSLIEGYQSTSQSPRISSTYDRPAPLVENAGFKGELYANPDRKLYDTLGLVSNLQTTPKGEERRSYLTRSLLSGTLWSIWRGPLKNPLNLGKQGNISQNGGDFVFGPGASCSYSSRMKHTEDHVEVSELMKAAGVSYP
ncbi:hypothetical protein EDB89DRAFT_2199627 [Lactarius sanguifluus]|nr:hypothetical protein EDB89DRAFT_2199627 [Lactarius sanguifluus]